MTRASLGTASDAECLRAEVGREPANERSVQVPEAEDPAAAHAGAALQQVHAPAALVTVGRESRCRGRCRILPWSSWRVRQMLIRRLRASDRSRALIIPARARAFAIAMDLGSVRLAAMSRAVPSQPALPIDDVLAPLRAALAAHPNVVLQAPPGAGKTTRVPLALRDAGVAGRPAHRDAGAETSGRARRCAIHGARRSANQWVRRWASARAARRVSGRAPGSKSSRKAS